MGVEDLVELAGRLQARCIAAGLTVATAESCSGGLVAASITANAGASAYFRGSVVAYADEVKRDLLGVPAATLEHHGAVSAQVAVAMAEGARARVGSDLAVAITGIAGPTGASEAKPIGLTYVAVAGPAGPTVARHHWPGDRAANVEASARAALEALLTAVETVRDPERG
jgi:PncC family amidohydrolase